LFASSSSREGPRRGGDRPLDVLRLAQRRQAERRAARRIEHLAEALRAGGLRLSVDPQGNLRQS
jgi:hypothetical protein